MANILLTPSIIAKEAIRVLYANSVLPNLVNKDYSDEFVNHVGDTINARIPAHFEAQEYVDKLTIQNANEIGVPVKMDKHLDVSFKVTSQDMALNIENFSEQLLQPAMNAFREQLDKYLIGKLAGASTVVDHSEGDIAPADIIALRSALNRNLAPQDSRYFVIGTTADADLLKAELFTDASKVGDDGTALREASLGRKYGFDIYTDQNIDEYDGDGIPSLAFHRDAVTLVTRPLEKPMGNKNSAIVSHDGFALRVVYGYDIKKKSDIVSVDMLCGVSVLNDKLMAVLNDERGGSEPIYIELNGANVQINHETNDLDYASALQWIDNVLLCKDPMKITNAVSAPMTDAGTSSLENDIYKRTATDGTVYMQIDINAPVYKERTLKDYLENSLSESEDKTADEKAILDTLPYFTGTFAVGGEVNNIAGNWNLQNLAYAGTIDSEDRFTTTAGASGMSMTSSNGAVNPNDYIYSYANLRLVDGEAPCICKAPAGGTDWDYNLNLTVDDEPYSIAGQHITDAFDWNPETEHTDWSGSEVFGIGQYTGNGKQTNFMPFINADETAIKAATIGVTNPMAVDITASGVKFLMCLLCGTPLMVYDAMWLQPYLPYFGGKKSLKHIIRIDSIQTSDGRDIAV